MLPTTAERFRGYCAACAKDIGWKAWIRDAGPTLKAAGFLLSLPVMFPWFLISEYLRVRKFPFNRRQLLVQIAKFQTDRSVALQYRAGVVDGFLKPELASCFMRSAYYAQGTRDGESLRSGELEFDDIPTVRVAYRASVAKPGSRTVEE